MGGVNKWRVQLTLLAAISPPSRARRSHKIPLIPNARSPRCRIHPPLPDWVIAALGRALPVAVAAPLLQVAARAGGGRGGAGRDRAGGQGRVQAAAGTRGH